jgi:predicted dehydrogenase
VFCQKPLGRTAAEVGAVVGAAEQGDRLLGVDLSYRFTSGMQAIRDLVRGGELGRVFAADLTFHNAYGPDKPWFYDPALSGGGCVMDLGVHLVDLALWALDWPEVVDVQSHLLSGGEPLRDAAEQCEDFAVATVALAGGTVLRLACSWRLPAGQEAVISAEFFGTAGGAALRNVDGSFYAFEALRMEGTSARALAGREDDWGSRAAADWARRLASGAGFDPDNRHLVEVAGVLDRIYGR